MRKGRRQMNKQAGREDGKEVDLKQVSRQVSREKRAGGQGGRWTRDEEIDR